MVCLTIVGAFIGATAIVYLLFPPLWLNRLFVCSIKLRSHGIASTASATAESAPLILFIHSKGAQAHTADFMAARKPEKARVLFH